MGNIEIHKIDSLTNKGISDTTFKINGNGVEKNIKTDINGCAKLEQMVPGTYQIVETISNPNYYIDTTTKTITVEAGKTKTLEISNKHAEGNLEIIKIDKQQNKRLKGVTFELYSEELSKVIYKGTTDENGVLKITNVRTGTYKLYEIETSKWYRLDQTKYSIEIKKDETTYKTIENEAKKGYITVNKYDEDFPEIKLENAAFEIYNSSGNKVDTITTDINGYAKSKQLPLQDTYKVKEIKCPKDYSLNNREIIVKFESDTDNQVININCENKHDVGKLEILKVDKINENIKIEGAIFELFSKEFNKVIARGKTDKDGKLEFNNLRTGEYSLYEVASNEWYKLDTTKRNIQIVKDQTNNITVQNNPKMGYISITKNDIDYKDILLEGAKFYIFDSAGNIVDTLITDSKGYAKSKSLPIYKTYIIKEVEAPKDYYINNDSITVEFESNNEGCTIEQKFEDRKKEGGLKLYKVDSTNSNIRLGNVEFDLYSKELNMTIGTFFTNVNGEIFVPNLRVADYTWIEKNTNSWYQLADTIQTRVVWNEITNNVIKNDLKSGKIKIIKADKNDNSIVLKGVKFNIMDERHNILETIITDDKGVALSKDYAIRDFENLYIQEIEPPKGYKINSKLIKVKIKDNEIVTVFLENEKEPITEIENEPELPKGQEGEQEPQKDYITNNPKTGDDFSILLMSVLLIISLMGGIYTIRNNILTKN